MAEKIAIDLVHCDDTVTHRVYCEVHYNLLAMDSDTYWSMCECNTPGHSPDEDCGDCMDGGITGYCVLCNIPVTEQESQVQTVDWVAHMECALRYAFSNEPIR